MYAETGYCTLCVAICHKNLLSPELAAYVFQHGMLPHGTASVFKRRNKATTAELEAVREVVGDKLAAEYFGLASKNTLQSLISKGKKGKR